LLGSCCDGTLVRWTEIKPEQIERVQLTEGCEYRCVNYSYTGRRFVAAGSKGVVEVYDDDRVKLVSNFAEDKKHKNTVFSAKFFPESESLLHSGGWDRQVKIWDVRTKEQTQVMFGPMTQGDTLDMQSDGFTLVTAGSVGGTSFQTFDLRNLG
jgi:WD40 repeat protein